MWFDLLVQSPQHLHAAFAGAFQNQPAGAAVAAGRGDDPHSSLAASAGAPGAAGAADSTAHARQQGCLTALPGWQPPLLLPPLLPLPPLSKRRLLSDPAAAWLLLHAAELLASSAPLPALQLLPLLLLALTAAVAAAAVAVAAAVGFVLLLLLLGGRGLWLPASRP